MNDSDRLELTADEDFLFSFKDEVDWEVIVEKRKMSPNLIRKILPYLHSNVPSGVFLDLFKYQEIPADILRFCLERKYIRRVDIVIWDIISRYQKLSAKEIIEFKDYLFYKSLYVNEKIDLHTYFELEELGEHINWKIINERIRRLPTRT